MNSLVRFPHLFVDQLQALDAAKKEASHIPAAEAAEAEPDCRVPMLAGQE